MKFCYSCGAENDDGLQYCNQCGALLPQSVGRRVTGFKIIAFVILFLLIAVAAITAIVFAVPNFFPSLKVDRAIEKTFDAFEESLDDNTNLIEAKEILQKQIKSGDYLSEFELAGINNGEYQIYNEYSISRRRKVLAGSAQIVLNQPEVDAVFRYSANRKSIQFSLTDSGINVYGFKFKDFNKAVIVSTLKKAFSIDNTNDLNFESLELKNIFSSLTTDTNDKLKKFSKSIDTEYIGKTTLLIDGKTLNYKVYRLTWSVKTAAEIIGILNDTELLSMEDSNLYRLIDSLEPSCLIYINEDGLLTGIDFVAAGKEYSLFLTGDENVWDKIILVGTTAAGDKEYIYGGIDKETEITRLYLGKDSSEIISFRFKKSTNEYILDITENTVFSGNVIIEGKNVMVTMEFFPFSSNGVRLQLRQSDIEEKPEMLASKYIDIFDLSLSDIGRILFEAGIKLD